MGMNFSTYYSKIFDRLYFTEKAEGLNALHEVRRKCPDIPFHRIRGKDEIPEEHRNAKTLFVSGPTGRMVDRCPGTRGHLCCNYLTINLYIGCAIGCTYCIMRWYLNFEPITVIADPRPGIEAVTRIARTNPNTVIRVGTGEVGDSLLYDPLFDLSRPFIESLAEYNNVYFELKTKTDFVDHLLEVPVKGNCVIAFSLNPKEVVDNEEPLAVSCKRRLKAARKVIRKGYHTAFHFDPIIFTDNWESAYLPVAEALGEFPSEKVAWISLGTLRYPPELKDKMADRPYLYDEFVRCKDGKFRYLQVKRIGIYRKMLETLRSAGIESPIYLCMESAAVWEGVFGFLPEESIRLRPIFGRCEVPE